MRPVDSEAVSVEGTRSPAGAAISPEGHSVRIEQMGDDVVLRDRQGPVASILFWGFLFLWWVVLAGFVRHVVSEPNLEIILFAAPFFSTWFFVLLGFCLRSCVRLGPDGLEESRNILGLRWSHHFRLDEINGVTEYEDGVDSEGNRGLGGLKIVTVGRSIRFARCAKSEERQWLIALLEGHLKTLQDGSTADRGSSAAAEPRRPSDSEITLQRDSDRLVFVRKSSGRVGTLVGMTFLNLFWNGLVAGFLLQLVKHFEWGLFLFLIPFEVIGAVILVVWLSALALLWRRREWVFHPQSITARASILGLGRTSTFDPQCLDRIELRKGMQSRIGLPDDEDVRSFALGFVDGEGWDVFAIDELTEREARWIESELRASIKGPLSGRTGGSPPTGKQGTLWDRWIDGPT